MIKNLSTSDLNVILSRLREQTSRLWYQSEMNSESITEDEKVELRKNTRLITEIEHEINSRIVLLKTKTENE